MLPPTQFCQHPQHLLDMLAPHQHLLQPVITALHGEREAVTKFFLDPSTDPVVIQLVQMHDDTVPILVPLFQASRTWVWSAHRARMKLLCQKCCIPPIFCAKQHLMLR